MTNIAKTIACVHCSKSFIIEVDELHYKRWCDGLGFIQDALPELESWERELLLSATCDECWKEMFPPLPPTDEDEDE